MDAIKKNSQNRKISIKTNKIKGIKLKRIKLKKIK